MSDRVFGGCLCGKVRYSFDRSKVISAHHCHCTDCQKSTGSGKATIVLVPTTAFDLEGKLKTYTVTGTDGSHVTRGFCDNCGSPLVSFIEENPALRIIKAGCIFDSSWIEISSSFWSDSAVAWSPVDEEHPFVPQNPNMA
ncbi:MAG: GFA family protein [Henriciella sp.]|nr:GFA family protein [Henriciella sp.]